jgi:hypothetical protein
MSDWLLWCFDCKNNVVKSANPTSDCGTCVRGPAMDTFKSSHASPLWPMNASPPSGHSRMPCTVPPTHTVPAQCPHHRGFIHNVHFISVYLAFTSKIAKINVGAFHSGRLERGESPLPSSCSNTVRNSTGPTMSKFSTPCSGVAGGRNPNTSSQGRTPHRWFIRHFKISLLLVGFGEKVVQLKSEENRCRMTDA